MNITCKELLGKLKDYTNESGINLKDPIESIYFAEIRERIGMTVSDIDKRTHPDAIVGAAIDPNTELTPLNLHEILTDLEGMLNEEAIGTAFVKLLDQKDKNFFIRFGKLVKEHKGEELKFQIQANMLNVFIKESSPLYRVIQAVLKDENYVKVMKEIIEEMEGEINNSHHPESINKFVELLRGEVMMRLQFASVKK